MPAAEKTWKFTKEYQPKDPNTGEPLGPPQVFGGDTHQELIDKLAAAHENASVRLYEVKRAAAVASVMDFDPERPIREFKSRALTADEKVRIATLRKDPATAEEATRIEMEALLGTSIQEVHEMLTKAEVDKHIEFIRGEVAYFVSQHPEYVITETNRELMNKWLEKHKVPATRKNLEYAFEALRDVLVLNVKKQETPIEEKTEKKVEPTTTVAASEKKAEEKAAETVPATETKIPDQTTPDSAITETPEQVRARTSSSGLGRANTSVQKTEGAAPKTVEITFALINAMTAAQYAKFCEDPANKAAVEKLYAGRSRSRA